MATTTDEYIGWVILACIFGLGGFLFIRRGIAQIKEEKKLFNLTINWIDMGVWDTHIMAVLKMILGGIMMGGTIFSLVTLVKELMK